MPDLTREELWRQLNQDILFPVYVLFGPESYLRDRASAQIVKHAFGAGDLRDFNLDEFSLNNKDAFRDAIAAAQQLPMMSTKRVVKVRDVHIAATAAKDTLGEECEELLAYYLADPSPSTVLIFLADELNGNRKITKLLKKNAEAIEFKRLEEAELSRWISRCVNDEGFRIEEPAVRRLIELSGADLRRLINELDKLCSASLPSKVVTLELVDLLVPRSNEIENFALTDAIVAGRGEHALRVLKKILDDGAEPIALLGLLSYNFRRMLIAKEMMSRGDDRREVASILKMRYREQEDFLEAARRADKTSLVRVFDRLFETDLAMKSSLGGGGDQGTRMQLEVLVCEIAGAMRR